MILKKNIIESIVELWFILDIDILIGNLFKELFFRRVEYVWLWFFFVIVLLVILILFFVLLYL